MLTEYSQPRPFFLRVSLHVFRDAPSGRSCQFPSFARNRTHPSSNRISTTHHGLPRSTIRKPPASAEIVHGSSQRGRFHEAATPALRCWITAFRAASTLASSAFHVP